VAQGGKESHLGILNEGDFFGQGRLAGQPLRMASATAMTDCALLRIEKKARIGTLHREHALSDMFVAYLLTRNIRYDADSVDQLVNSSEKRLARIPLLLAHLGKERKTGDRSPQNEPTNAGGDGGTTRARVSFFMNRFRKLGFIDYYSGSLQVHSSLLNIVLHDNPFSSLEQLLCDRVIWSKKLRLLDSSRV
jgi:CRP/FNR family transcriptional regulator, cyclic AMP receptor protein